KILVGSEAAIGGKPTPAGDLR
ncbi:MAG: hypothetical protein K0S85_306, partial [Pseudomonas orientalis]|nr:hypothetical protein [Pseudomonas orientalis]